VLAEIDTEPSFQPPFWLRNRHLQSILPSLALRRPGVRRRCTQLIRNSSARVLECGNGVRLLGYAAAAARPAGSRARLAIILHGWEGSSDSMYVLSLGQFLLERGMDVFRLNLRDHGDSHHLNRGLFHSCLLPEVRDAVVALARQYPGHQRSMIGFSLGGNFALRVGAALAGRADLLARIIAVSPVLDPQVTLVALEDGLPLYRRYFIRKWRRSLTRKQRAWPDDYDFTRLSELDTLTAMTEQLVLRHTGYRTLAEYFQGYAITGSALQGLKVPSRILLSQDDPIIPSRDVSRLAMNPALSVMVTRHGGHCGFRDSLSGRAWVDRFVHESLTGQSCHT